MSSSPLSILRPLLPFNKTNSIKMNGHIWNKMIQTTHCSVHSLGWELSDHCGCNVFGFGSRSLIAESSWSIWCRKVTLNIPYSSATFTDCICLPVCFFVRITTQTLTKAAVLSCIPPRYICVIISPGLDSTDYRHGTLIVSAAHCQRFLAISFTSLNDIYLSS
jgi:hypothetical protein